MPQTIRVKKAKGIKLWDSHGKEYLDFSSQTLNLNLGNSPDIAKKAFLKQFDKYTFLSTRFESDVFRELSKKLISIAPLGLTKINLKLTNGGDANESAFKRARIYRKKPYIISFYWSHLGEGCETLRANGKNFNADFLGGSSYFIHILPPFSSIKTEGETLEELSYLFQFRNDIAAIIIEPIMVNAGVYIFSKHFLKVLRNLCDTYNITLIFDEIQTAFGWLGTMFASSYFEVYPDILTMGKALGCGFPLAGIMMKKEYDVLNYGYDEYTYGGHPISCAIALENIRYLKSSKILNDVSEKGAILGNMLKGLSLKYKGTIVQIRSCGLMAGITFISNKIANKVYDVSLTNGLILRKSMDGQGQSLVLKPPIIVSEKELETCFALLESSIKNVLEQSV